MTKEEIEKQIHQFAELMYKTGYEDAQKDWYSIEKEEREMNYKRGLDDAWDCARKIMLCEAKGGFSTDKYTEIFGNIATFQVLEILSASEAIFAIKEYEDKHTDNEIKLWDEVIIKRSSLGFEGTKGIVINTNPSEFNGLIEVLINYATSHHYKPENLEKTGKSYPELGNILDQLKGDNDQ